MDRGGRHQQPQQGLGLGRGQGRGRGRGRGAPVRGRGVHVRCFNEIMATVIDHVVNHDLSMREAGQRVRPNLSRHTVAQIVCMFGNDNVTLQSIY